MKDMKMKTKMIIGFTIPIILAIINVLIGMSSVRMITNKVSDMQESEVKTVQRTMEEIGADEAKAQVLIDTLTSAKKDDMASIQRTANLANLFSGGLIAISVLISLFIAFALIKAINQAVKQLSDAATDIALGRVDIEMVKYHNDEFGDLVDKYTEVINNSNFALE